MAYKGKYPNRIKAVWSNDRRTHVQTNGGITYRVLPNGAQSPMPTLGDAVIDGNVIRSKKTAQCIALVINKGE